MKIKNLLQLAPELYLIFATIYYWFLTSNLLNPIAIGLLLVLLIQLKLQHLKFGLILASIFILLNIYMVLALISELSDFNEADAAFTQLIIIGSIFLGLNLIVSILMFRKYIIKSIKFSN